MLQIVPIGAAYRSVVAYRLGALEDSVQEQLLLPEHIACIGFELAPQIPLIVGPQQNARYRQDDRDREHPAQQDDSQKLGTQRTWLLFHLFLHAVILLVILLYERQRRDPSLRLHGFTAL